MHEQGSPAANSSTEAARERRQVRDREESLEAMLVVCGELGYGDATARRVIARAGTHTVAFYRQFRNRADCYAAAYEQEAGYLVASLLAAAAAEGEWREGLRVALTRLFDYIVARPLPARAILSEVYVAGGDALVMHQEFLERLSRAVDSARREIPSRQAPPPITGTFMVSAIEGSVRYRLMSGRTERLHDELPVLMHLVVGAYLGDEAGREERHRRRPEGP